MPGPSLVPDLRAQEPAKRRIENRSGLVHALTEAAEVEHGLMVQYLFAAFSMKTGHPEESGLPVGQAERVRRWKASILTVARQEMAHLGTVCNLLTAVGGAPHFRLPTLPARSRYFPTRDGGSLPFELERFSARSLQRFVEFERPFEPDRRRLLVEQPALYGSVGELYGRIRAGFELLAPTRKLFVGPPTAQDEDDWTAALSLKRVTDLSSALEAIRGIVEEGEGASRSPEPSPAGTPAGRPPEFHLDTSHFARFSTMRAELVEEGDAFDPARPVITNPLTRPADPAVEHVDEPGTVAVSELFNWVYATMLMLLGQHYAFGGDSEGQRETLRATARQVMSGVVRPLGELLTELPAHTAGPATAGPSFELYADVRLPAHRASAWTLMEERLAQAAEACDALKEPHPRLGLVHEHLRLAGRRLASGRDAR